VLFFTSLLANQIVCHVCPAWAGGTFPCSAKSVVLVLGGAAKIFSFVLLLKMFKMVHRPMRTHMQVPVASGSHIEVDCAGVRSVLGCCACSGGVLGCQHPVKLAPVGKEGWS